MGERYPKLYRGACRCRVLLGLALPLAGCVSPWWNGLLSPHEVGNYRENRVNEIQQSISFRDKPTGIPGSTDPTPEDLIATVEEYQIGPEDGLSIRLLNYLQIGLETELTLMVDELGYIHVPQIGWVHVEGMTTRQIQQELTQQAKNAGIYPADSNPTITVQVLSRQHRTYNIAGAITSPGEYPIIRPDLRLREAVNQAGSLSEMVKVIYVFRNEPRQKRIKSSPAPAAGSRGVAPAVPSEPAWPSVPVPPSVPAPPVTPDSLSEMGAGGGPAASHPVSVPAPGTRPPGREGLKLPKEEVERDLLEAVGPASVPARTQAASATALGTASSTASGAASGAASGPVLPTYIYVNNEFVEAPRAPGTGAATQSWPATTPLAGPRPPAQTGPSGPVDWEELAAEGQQRVIRVPAEKIRHGDPNYNIVVRHQDWIELDPGQIGVFYIGGHVMREGVYSLNGEEITLTQAVVSAGGLDQLAWPTRCEIRRRLDGSREEITQWDLSRIMAGQDPDLFIKKDDVIRVGTHAAAPLLAMIRNSFRLTYGFGFVYDRNFADIDAFAGQQNPRDTRRSQRLARGLLQ